MKINLLSLACVALLGLSAAPVTNAAPVAASTVAVADFYAFGYADGVEFKNSHSATEIQAEKEYAQDMYESALQTQGRGEVDYWRGYLNGLNS